jgi:hypothetical protein
MNLGPSKEMPQYRCHKVVRAAKITEVNIIKIEQPGEPLVVELILGDIGIWTAPVIWHERNKPEAGGYLVQYEDGYRSYSPAKAFEEGYTKIDEPPTGWKPVDMLPTPALCHSDKRWWESPSGEWFCGTCHPTPWNGKGYLHPNDRIKP